MYTNNNFEIRLVKNCYVTQVQYSIFILIFMLVLSKYIFDYYYRIPSATIYGAFSSSALLYFTDWKAVLQYMPFYSGQFKPREY